MADPTAITLEIDRYTAAVLYDNIAERRREESDDTESDLFGALNEICRQLEKQGVSR